MIKEINFYQLSFFSVTQVMLNLLEKINTLNSKTIIYNSDKTVLKEWDNKLWTEFPSSWAPHTMDSEIIEETPTILTDNIDKIPINKINDFGYLIFSASDKPEFESIRHFSRIFIIFDKNDVNCLNNARELWLNYKNNQVTMHYWQEENKKWHKKSSVNNT